MDDCDFDNIFNEAEKYKQLILDNIDDLASNFAEDTPFEATGDEPQWLLSALQRQALSSAVVMTMINPAYI
ncbi:hypothetical protein [Synechococcus sp. A15-44]|uniref:hypothetical protein n=1 Tax=Synechococcus sp. A15-44 TaxID=1050646 RepID=UPI0016461E90|nr:hypothetical protein [Synechococcus sp. A15-44]